MHFDWLKHIWKELLAGIVTFSINLSKGVPSPAQILESLILGAFGWLGAILLQWGFKQAKKAFKTLQSKWIS